MQNQQLFFSPTLTDLRNRFIGSWRSGWEYAQIIQGGKSFIALSEGLQNALFACGRVPQQHRTDSLSAVYRNMGGTRHKPLTRLYDALARPGE